MVHTNLGLLVGPLAMLAGRALQAAHAYRLSIANLPEGQSALDYTRQQLDRLRIGQELTQIPWKSKRYKMLPSATIGESAFE